MFVNVIELIHPNKMTNIKNVILWKKENLFLFLTTFLFLTFSIIGIEFKTYDCVYKQYCLVFFICTDEP